MVRQYLIICFLLILLGCDEKKTTVQGVITEVNYRHIGRNKYKQVVAYAYCFGNQEYVSTSSSWFSWQGYYAVGDSVKITLDSSKPQQSKIIGKLKQPKPLKVIKLKSKK